MVNFFENFREIFLHRLSGGRELRKRVRPDGAAPFSAPAERGARTAAGGFALTGRLLSLHRLSGVLELPQAGSPYPGGSFSAPAERGARTAAGGFAPDGAAPFSAPAERGMRTALACSPQRAGSFSLNLSGGFAVCGRRGRCGARRGDKKEGTPTVSLPL